MAEPVSNIRNLGPASVEAYARAGINTAEELRELGPDVAYSKFLEAGGQAHFIGYYALVMGLQGRPWNDCQGQEKKDLRKRFDAIKKSAKSKSEPKNAIERELDMLGVGKIRRNL